MLKTTNITRRLAGVPVQIERQSDGIQRQEWMTNEGGVPYGIAFKAKWNDYVTARTTGGEEKRFAAFAYGGTEPAFTAARLWVVATQVAA